MDKFIVVILVIALLGNMILDIRVIKSNKERVKISKELLEKNKKLREDLANHSMEHRVKNIEDSTLIRKLNTLNRKLTILNKANYKKY